MNYAGKFGSGTPDNFSSADLKIDSLAHHAGGDTVTIPDAHLLFSGDYSRSGADLIVSDQLHRVVVPNYFHGDKRPALVSPDGATLDPSFIEAMTGHVQYAQAASSAAAAAAKVVGHVVKMTGSASVVRNGVTITLNNGDNLLQNDVVQTGSGSTLGLVMIDGTTFNLSAGARLMLNDLTYEAGSTSNSSLFTLVQGAASFVAGQVAKTGDMKVGTPVATMGIRGTAVTLGLSATDGTLTISVHDQRDGQIHAVEVFNARGILIATVTSNGGILTLTPVTNFEVIAQASDKTVAQIALEFNTFQALLQTYEVGRQLFPNLPQHTENINPSPNATRIAGGSPSPDSPYTVYHGPADGLGGGNLPSGGGTPVTFVADSTGPGPTGTPTPGAGPIATFTVIIPPNPLPFVVTPPTVNQISGPGGDHFGPVMSADGHFIVYDPDGAIFLYDQHTNTTIMIAPAADGFSYRGQTISADGRYVVFQGSDGNQSYIFIYNNDPSDAHYQQTTQLFAGSAPSVSGDGSRIVVEHGGNSIGIYDQQGHVIAVITPAAIGETGAVWLPAVSADGHMIAFWQTDASTPGGSGQLFVYDLSTGVATAIASTATDAGNSTPSFSADGRYVVYQSDAPGGHSEIYLYDLSTAQVVFHTANASGASYNPAISPDGHYIIFASDAQLTGDNNAVTDTYVVDVSNPADPVYTRVSNLNGGPPADANLGATISAGGLYVAFASSAAPGTGDIFLVDPTSGRSAIIRESANAPAILTAGGVIALTGAHNGATLSVVDPTGRFTASFNTNGDIVWGFSEPKSDFAALLPGQSLTQNFAIILTNASGTTTIPVRVVVYDGDQPVAAVVVANPGSIAGDNGNNTLTGTLNNDILQGFGGDDTIIGLAGVDRAVYLDATGGITVNMAAGTVTGQGVGLDTLNGVEAIQGSNFVDHYSAAGFTGVSGVPGVPFGFNSFEGMAGDDIITGNVNMQGQALTRISYASASAAVTVDFIAGTATGDASVGTDHFTNVNAVIGSRFDDTLRGSDNANSTYEQYEGRGGNDLINGRGGYDFATYNNDPATHSGVNVNLAAGTVAGDASIGNDTLRGVESVRGTNFADTFTAVGFNGGSTNAGSLGNFNNFDGADGNDAITGNGSTRIQYSNATAAVLVDLANTSSGGTGIALDRADAINLTSLDLASVGIDTIHGGVNAVMGSTFGDSLSGSANNENFQGLGGDDFINGRGGFDVAQYNNPTYTTGGISVGMALGIVTGDGSTGTDTLRSIEGIQGTYFNDVYDATNFGTAGYLDGSLYNVGNNGTFNQFEGQGGDDEITGNGNTRAVYFNAAAGVTVDLALGTGRGTDAGDLAKVGNDTFLGGVNGAFGSAHDDTLLGSNNTAPGSIEQFDGRGGDDTIDGRGGFDQVTYGNDPNVSAGITVHMAVDLGDDGPLVSTVDGDAAVGHDILNSIESVIGTRFGDSYDALNFTGFNEFQGLGGDDQITGNEFTQLGYYNATSAVTVDMDLGTADGDASVGHDTFSGVNQIRGSLNFGDTLRGDGENNTLDGLGGNDLLDGRGGDDMLIGGSGGDTFVYAAGYGADTIADFNHSEGDRVDLSGVPGMHSLDDVLALAHQGEEGVFISFGNDDTLTLSNVSLAGLVESDFIFAHPATIIGDYTGEVSEDGILTDASGNVVGFDAEAVHDGGTLTVQDPDSGQNHFQAVAELALQGDYGSFTFDENTGEWTYELDHGLANSLAAGQTEYDTLTVTSADGTATEDIVVAVHGSNDAPVAVAVTRAGLEGNGTVTGSLASLDIDPDQGDTLTFGQSGTVAGFAIFSSGFYNFNSGDAAYDYLAAGATTDVVAHYTVTDGDGEQSTADITITLTGTNDAPCFTGDDRMPTYAAGNTAPVALLENVAASDIDSADYAGGSLTATVTAGFHVGDTLSIAESEYIQVLGNVVSFDADGDGSSAIGFVDIGTLSGSGTSLTVTLNASATNAAVAALAEAVRFETTDTTVEDRTVTFTLNDGDGIANGGHDFTRIEATVGIPFDETNDAPVVTFVAQDPSINLIANGGFESGTADFAPYGSITDWSVAGDIDVVTTAMSWEPAEGNRSIDLSGNNAATISQSFTTLVGRAYTVHFSLAGNYGEGNSGSLIHDLRVSAGDRTEDYQFDSNGRGQFNMGWADQTFTFTATATTTTLSFASLDPGNSGPALDNISAALVSGIAVVEDTPTRLTGISVSDVDSGASPITVTLALPAGNSGLLSAANFGGVTVGGTATALTLTGSVADINAFLADGDHGVIYTPAADSTDDVTLTITAEDGGGEISVAQTVLLDITAVNDAPVFSAGIGIAMVGRDADDMVGGTSGTVDPGAPVSELTGNSFSFEIRSRFAGPLDPDDFNMLIFPALGEPDATTDDGLHVGYRDSGAFTFGFWGDDLNYGDSVTSTADVGQWVTWAGTYDADTNTRRLYRDGVLVAEDFASGDYIGNGNITIGTSDDYDRFFDFNGSIDYVRIFSDVLSAEEIADHASGAPSTGNLLDYEFNEGSGATAIDSSAEGNNGTITNTSRSGTSIFLQGGNGAGVPVVTGVSVFDPDNANFNGGTFTAEITGGLHDGDMLSIENGSTIYVLGGIYYDADGDGGGGPIVVIGSISADTGTSLTITLTADADAAAVAALTEAIRFSSSSTDQTGDTRQVTFTLDDGSGTAGGGDNTDSFVANVIVDYAPLIMTDDLQLYEGVNGTTTVGGLFVSDPDAGFEEPFTISAVTGAAALGSTVTPSTGSGTLADINIILENGVTYDPGASPPDTDMVTLTVTDGPGVTDTVNFIFNQAGMGPVTLQGTSGKDVIFATGYTDTLTGGASPDQFVFTANSGDDIITDFMPGHDRIDLMDDFPFIPDDQSSFDDWLTLSGDVVQQGEDTLITLGCDSILLSNVSRNSLQMNDFILHPNTA